MECVPLERQKLFDENQNKTVASSDFRAAGPLYVTKGFAVFTTLFIHRMRLGMQALPSTQSSSP